MSMFRKLLCRHTHLQVKRMHPSTVPKREKGKVLYVDELHVWNFICCADCGKMFDTDQKERLFAEGGLT